VYPVRQNKRDEGDTVEQPHFHLVLDGRRMGPYDRRTIVGMRIRQTIGSDQRVVGSDGVERSVGDLIREGRPDFQPQRTASFGPVLATYPGCLRKVSGRGIAIPKFQGELEVRVQADVLRIAGRFRQGLRSKETRVKLPLQEIVHASACGSEVNLGLRATSGVQRVRLDLLSEASAAELLRWLPNASPWPERRRTGAGQVGLMWAAGAATFVVLVLVGAVLASRY